VIVTTSGAFGVEAITVTVGSTVRIPELMYTVTVVSMTVTTPGTGCWGGTVTVTTAGASVEVLGAFVSVTTFGDEGWTPVVGELWIDWAGVGAVSGIETVMVGVIDGQGEVIVMIWTDCDDVAVGLHGTVTVLRPPPDDEEDPDNGAPTLDWAVSVLA
jgi:hypothetical protein